MLIGLQLAHTQRQTWNISVTFDVIFTWTDRDLQDLIPVLLNADPSALIQRRVGVGKPVASHRRITLLPSDDVILVAEIITDGLRHWSSSARWNRTPAKFSGPLHVRNWSINATGMLLILDNSMSLEIRQSQYQGLSCRPANIEISA